jgi:hypothetical protein
MKKRDGGKYPASQRLWTDKLRLLGWVGRKCDGAREAVEYLKSLGYNRQDAEDLE